MIKLYCNQIEVCKYARPTFYMGKQLPRLGQAIFESNLANRLIFLFRDITFVVYIRPNGGIITTNQKLGSKGDKQQTANFLLP